MLCYIEPHDPNEYINFLHKDLNVKFYKRKQNPSSPIIKKDEVKLPIRETINIEVEINSINDILKLIETYKNDPEIEYNIDIKA
jgi:hypothetical protein